MLLHRLFKPLDYLRVHHPQKRKYDFWIPLIISAVLIAVLYYLPLPVPITGDGGLLAIFTSLLQILVGFYIASLAAVATFDRPSMDKVMLGDPPTLKINVRGKTETEKLTRRRFLSLLFGYLSLISFFLYFVGAFADLFEPNIRNLLPVITLSYVKWISLYVYLFMVANLIVSTLLGLFYMTEKIHRDSEEIIVKKNSAKAKIVQDE